MKLARSTNTETEQMINNIMRVRKIIIEVQEIPQNNKRNKNLHHRIPKQQTVHGRKAGNSDKNNSQRVT